MLQNQTVIDEFILLSFTNSQIIRHLLFPVFSLLYMMTVSVNFLIMVLIHHDFHLHTPMYFFLMNLASLDAFSSSVIIPRILVDLLTEKRIISRVACVTQIFFFLMFATAESFLLVGMSYDRYIAICLPLHYVKSMSWKICGLLASVAWSLGFSNALIHALCTHNLVFCAQNIIDSFFCDLPLLLQLSCTDIFINMLVIFFATFTLGFFAVGLTFAPYVPILQAIWRIPTKEGKRKAFSTCTSHISVVFTFYGSLFFTFLRPASIHHPIADILVPIVYTAITPILNPIIYSLRNKDLKGALHTILLSSLKG
ncbi:hypothetical protein XELAEV_18045751mg [Xenopus laevis]|uniref:Olfactory receptor n=1 Tax=Xenopus laevis TaxID=8355 RepID=A0A974H4J8_XENLA|nr:hypothetical protein XELAEV_18045751mg [Xenopus laevis]